MQPRAQFAKNLRDIRQERGISQEALAWESGLHRTAVGLLERRKSEPRLSTIVKLARALEVEPCVLLRGVR